MKVRYEGISCWGFYHDFTIEYVCPKCRSGDVECVKRPMIIDGDASVLDQNGEWRCLRCGTVTSGFEMTTKTQHRKLSKTDREEILSRYKWFFESHYRNRTPEEFFGIEHERRRELVRLLSVLPITLFLIFLAYQLRDLFSFLLDRAG